MSTSVSCLSTDDTITKLRNALAKILPYAEDSVERYINSGRGDIEDRLGRIKALREASEILVTSSPSHATESPEEPIAAGGVQSTMRMKPSFVTRVVLSTDVPGRAAPLTKEIDMCPHADFEKAVDQIEDLKRQLSEITVSLIKAQESFRSTHESFANYRSIVGR